MFNKVLIANRGEIAVRIIRACHSLGISTVAVYSKADADSLHVMLADEAILIGEAASKDSYLNMENIISAAVITNATAIHPGFGFLSENQEFATLCEKCGIKFIGPSGHIISQMGDKSTARKLADLAGVNVVPGSVGLLSNVEEAKKLAREIKYPVLIKATSGGGGRGMRIVTCEEEMENMYHAASSEALNAFGDGDLYMEKFIVNPKHIEVQILADQHRNVISLAERDCSVQRRNQKVIEEAPGPTITPELRKELGEVAVRLAKNVNYENAGTIEFIMDEDNNYYFIEMNTRIQVEHPITEAITGIDLIAWQIKIAAGEKLTIKQKDVKINGHAIECRINCEDVKAGFIPKPGTVNHLNFPTGPGVRIDTLLYQDYTVSQYYDSMIAKLICVGATRDEAINRMLQALSELIIEPLHTNIELHEAILKSAEFKSGKYTTGFLAPFLEELYER